MTSTNWQRIGERLQATHEATIISIARDSRGGSDALCFSLLVTLCARVCPRAALRMFCNARPSLPRHVSMELYSSRAPDVNGVYETVFGSTVGC